MSHSSVFPFTLQHSGRALEEITDPVLTDLIHYRRTQCARQGTTAFALFSVALVGLLGSALWISSHLLLVFAAVILTTLAMLLGVCTERLGWWRFYRHAQSLGVSENAAEQIYNALANAETLIAKIELCGQKTEDRDLIAFVRP